MRGGGFPTVPAGWAMASDRLKHLVAELRQQGHLPALDTNVREISSLAGDPLTCVAELTSVILRDASMTASIISTANSACYAPVEPVKTVSSAILLVGFERVRSLALGLGVVKQVSTNARSRNLYRLFASAYFSGLLAMSLGRRLGHANPEELFVAGLVTALPRLLLAHGFPERYGQIEQQTLTHKRSLESACEDVFGCGYEELGVELAQLWNLPREVAAHLSGERRGETGGRAVRNAARIADMMFGSAPGGTAAMEEVERELRQTLGLPEFSLSQFVVEACGEDTNVERYFKLLPKDLEMMVRIVEWGKVNPAQVAASLTYGAAREEMAGQPESDPALLIGQYLTDLAVGGHRDGDINRLLLTAMEALYRCLDAQCVLLAFSNPGTRQLEGRYHLGSGRTGRANEFCVDLRDPATPVSRCFEALALVRVSVQKEWPQPFLVRGGIGHVILAPIAVAGSPIGLFVVGTENTMNFSRQEESWVEAVVEHVAMGFARRRPSPASS